MDNYSLEDVKKIDEKGLLNKKVLKRIIISVVRRIEIYNDYSEIKILKYLRKSNEVDQELKREIDEYIYKFEGHVIENKDNKDSKTILIITLILMIAVTLFIILRR